MKIWDQDSGDNFTSIEPAVEGDINDVMVWKESGLITIACDAQRIQVHLRLQTVLVHLQVSFCSVCQKDLG